MIDGCFCVGRCLGHSQKTTEATRARQRNSLSIGLLALVVIPVTSGLAAASERSWIVSGLELKQAIEGNYAPEIAQVETRRLVSAAKGRAYIYGVADATGRDRWCDGDEVAPHELVDRVYTHLSDIPGSRLSENASSLVRESLTTFFPCKN